MDQVVRFARAYQWEVASRDTPIVHNFLGWPDRAALSDDDRKELGRLVSIDEASEPPGILGLSKRAAALASMRQKMTAACHARVCLSGKAKQPSADLVSGVLEEASYMAQRGRPLFMSGMMGGAALLFINRLRGIEVEPAAFGGEPRRTEELLRPFQKEGAVHLARISGLTEEQQSELFDSQNIDTLVELTARGLLELKRLNNRLGNFSN